MFKKSFVKYARIISDDNQRRNMYKLHVAKNIFSIANILLLLIDVILCVSLQYVTASSEGLSFTIAPVPVIFTACWLVFFIAYIAVSIAFDKRYKDILFRYREENEFDEMYSYRQKVQKEHKRKKVFRIMGFAFLIIGVAAVIAAITMDSIAIKQNGESSSLTSIAIAVYVIFFICSIICFFIPEMKSVLNDYDLDEDTAREVRAIDTAQGRKVKLTISKDPERERFKYTFPTKELYSKAEQMKKYRNKLMFITMLFVAVAFLIFCILMNFGFIEQWSIWGYSFPIFVTILAVLSIITYIPYSRNINALQRQQNALIEGDESYKNNMEIILRVTSTSKKQTWLGIISSIISIILGFTLAAIFPNQLVSVVSVAPLFIACVIGIILNHRLNKAIAPFKAKIDEKVV